MAPDKVDYLLAGARENLVLEFDKMSRAQEAQDLAALSKAAHTVKGCLLNLGIADWAELAKFIENNAWQKKSCSYDLLIKQLREGVQCLL